MRIVLFLLVIFFTIPDTPAQSWPTKPVRIISPFAPGGGNDTLSRLLAASLTPRLAQQVMVENRPGANTIVGTEFVVKSAPDGYTLILLPNAITINPHLYRKLPFDIARDLAPVTRVGTSPLVLVVLVKPPKTRVPRPIALLVMDPTDPTGLTPICRNPLSRRRVSPV